MLKRWQYDSWLGGVALLIALGIGLAALFWGTFADEGDNLAVGMMLSRGSMLYRDVFSHHFPFAYYWTAVITGVFGPSIAAARVSALLFQIGSLAWAMYVTRYFVPIGLLGILWSIVGLFFFGNLVLYTVFSGVALTVVFMVMLAILSKRIPAGRKELFTLGIFAFIAVLSDPLAIYPILCLLVFLALSPVRLKGSVQVGALITLGLGAYVVYLFASGSLDAFYQDVIRFNAEVYRKYTALSPLRLDGILNLIGTALNLNGRPWQTDPYLILKREQLDYWLFTGFLFRLTVVLAALILALRRRWKLAAFVYLYAVMLLAMNQETFRVMPFFMTAGFVGMWLIFDDLDGAAAGQSTVGAGRVNRSVKWLAFTLLPWTARCVIGFGYVWLVLRSADTLSQTREQLSYTGGLGYPLAIADHIRNDLACGQTDVSLAYYPGEPTFNFLTGFRPVSKYLYLFPWVAEVALPQVLDSLATGRNVVYVDWNSMLWGKYQAADYLASLKTYLEASYHAAGEGFYVSPELARECHFTRFYPQVFLPAEIPDGEITPGRKYTQTFTSDCAGLNSFEILPASYPRAITSTLNVRFRDLDADQQLFDRAIPGPDISDSQWLRISFDPLPDSQGKQYRISLVSADAQSGNAFGVWRTASDVYPGGEAAINGQPLNADWAFRYGCRW
jgi:hypothetical protein